ncbi:transporter substrate-binding domain-containing protein [Photobacterium sanguinicancri]|uniref:transporter substrate-binding domain-containing protein n=1 Tax=Photobacterium sanguinicancri TaxID=875932 RepID=UPI0026E368E5|nr:transporter substrate-binding domain-containing protein [Photobacterium sanguinicancri]MDO6500080.1 transporter substrate-binding domain-containing protein [Photobacterium sanguinicancri]
MLKVILFVFLLIAPAFNALSSDIQVQPTMVDTKPATTVLTVQNKVLRIGYPNFDWAPFTYVSDRGHMAGLLPSIMYEIAKESGYTTQTVIYPNFDDVLKGFNNNEIDILVGVSSTFERKKIMHFSKPLVVVPMAVVSKDPSIQNIQDLTGQVISVESGFAIEEQLRQLANKKLNIEQYSSSSAAFNAMRIGDANAYIGNAITLRNMLSREDDRGAIAFQELPDLPYERLYIASHKNNTTVIADLNAAYASLSQHTLTSIYDTWLTTSQQRYLNIENNLNLTPAEQQWIDNNSTLKVGYHPNDFPYQFSNPNGEMDGISADILAEIGKLLKISISPIPVTSLKSVLPKLEDGKFDVIAAVTCTPDRKKLFHCTQPYTEERWVIVDNAEQGPFLTTSKIGVLKNRYGHILSKKLFSDNPLAFYDNNEELLKAAMNGKIDVAIISLSSASSLLQSEFLGRLQIISSKLDSYYHPVGMAVSKDNLLLRDLLNKALNAIPPQKFSEIEKQWQTVTVHQGIAYKKLLLWGAVISLISALIIFTIMYWNRKLTNEVKQRKQVEQQLTYLTNNFDGVLLQHFQRSDDPSDIELLFVSNKVHDLIGISASKLFTQPMLIFRLLKQRDDNKDILASMREACKNGYWKTELQLKSIQTSQRWIEIRCHITPQNEGWQWNTILLDITQMKEQQHELELARKDAEAATVAKSRFLAMMSHEIRTPISGVLSLLELLTPYVCRPEAKSIHTSLVQSGNNLLNIVNDVLDFSKVEAGKLSLSVEHYDMANLIHEVVRPHVVHAEQKGVRFKLWVDPTVAETMVFDPLRLRQIMNNLLNNATKFTDHGHIGLLVDVASLHDNQQTLRFTIEDSGIGISNRDIQNLFQPFEQADISSERRFSGTGLGLSICRQLIQLMGGEIHVESQVNIGSQFIFHLTFPVIATSTNSKLLPNCGLINLSVEQHSALYCYLNNWSERSFNIEAYNQQELLASLQLQEQKQAVNTLIITEYDFQALHLTTEWIAEHFSHVKWILLRQSSLLSPEPSPYGWVLSLSPLMPIQLKHVLTTQANDTDFEHDVHFNAQALHAQSENQLSVAKENEETDIIANVELKPFKILVAEDHPINQQIIAQQLLQLGYQADITDNGQFALNALHQQRYDLLLTDCHMPELDGYGLASAVRQQGFRTPTGKPIPIIALTANAAASEKSNCKANGFDQCLFKPVTLQQLDTALALWLHPDADITQHEGCSFDLDEWDLGDFSPSEEDSSNISGSLIYETFTDEPSPFAIEEAILSAEKQSIKELASNEVISLASLSAIFGDPALCQQILQQYHQACLTDLAELKQAIQTQDIDNTRLISHRMKGAARMVEYQSLAQACENMEQLAQHPQALTDDNAVKKQLKEIELHIHQLEQQVSAFNESTLN